MNENTITITQRYSHLNQAEREYITLGLSHGISISMIAKCLKRHRSTIYREIERNTSQAIGRYLSYRAQVNSDARKKKSHQRERIKSEEVRNYIEEKLKEYWSPEIIAAKVSLEYPHLKTNYESIYQWLYYDRRDLIPFLVFQHKKRRNRASGRNKRAVRIPNRTMIDERPAFIQDRTEAGDWEADTAVSRQSKAAIMAAVERKSRFLVASKLDAKSAEPMKNALVDRLSVFPQHLRKSITYDNGTENAQHEETNALLNTQSFFCNPYHSWEKGSIENRIGIIRRYFPKKTDWNLISQVELDTIVLKINNRPLKCLGYQSPYEVFVALRS